MAIKTGRYPRTKARTDALYDIRPIEWSLIRNAIQAMGHTTTKQPAWQTLLDKIDAI